MLEIRLQVGRIRLWIFHNSTNYIDTPGPSGSFLFTTFPPASMLPSISLGHSSRVHRVENSEIQVEIFHHVLIWLGQWGIPCVWGLRGKLIYPQTNRVWDYPPDQPQKNRNSYGKIMSNHWILWGNHGKPWKTIQPQCRTPRLSATVTPSCGNIFWSKHENFVVGSFQC